jgi:hypothetical protein
VGVKGGINELCNDCEAGKAVTVYEREFEPEQYFTEVHTVFRTIKSASARHKLAHASPLTGLRVKTFHASRSSLQISTCQNFPCKFYLLVP